MSNLRVFFDIVIFLCQKRAEEQGKNCKLYIQAD